MKKLFPAAMLAIVMLYACNDSDNTDRDLQQALNTLKESPKDNQAKVLSATDSEEIRGKLVSLNSYLDHLESNGKKAMNQYNRFVSLFNQYIVTGYEVYRAAEVANNTYSDFSSKIYQIEAPDKLPKPLQTEFNDAMNSISTCYSMMAEAMNNAMEIYNSNNVDYRQVDKFRNDLRNANSLYKEGIAKLFQVGKGFGVYDKLIKKKHKNR